jgi:hypothetical protein
MIRVFSFLLLGLWLTGCTGQNARDILGLDRRSPDEFRVVSRPPLSTPPDFQLRPPVEGQEGLGLPPADLQAKSLVVDGRDISGADYDIRRTMGAAETAVGVVESYEVGTTADKALLGRAGVVEADPNIRARLYEERKLLQEEKKDNWLIPATDGDVIVDAEAEKERLKENQEAGKAVTEGETPVIEPKQRGILEKLF